MKFRFRNLLTEPYRLFFFVGTLYSILTVGIWFTWMHALDHSTLLFKTLEGAPFIHSHVMIYGVVSFYVFGFLLTAFPRFVNQPLPNPKIIMTLGGLLILGQLFFLLGTLSQPIFLLGAMVFEVGAFFSLFAFLSRLYLKQGFSLSKKQPLFLLAALLMGGMGTLSSYLYYNFRLSLGFYSLSIELGTYGYLLLLVIAVTYRVVPFFAGRVLPNYTPRQGPWTLEIVLLLILTRLAFHFSFSDSVKLNYAAWAVNMLLLVVLVREWGGWLSREMKKFPLLFILFLGLFWILIFLGFSAYEMLAHLTHPQLAVFPVFRTPALHAFYIGCLGTLLLGISTRVVRGHGGLPLTADKTMLVAMIFIQSSAVIRVMLPLLDSHWPVLVGKNYWAGIFWVAAFILWTWRYLPLLGAPPMDSPPN